MYRPIFRDFMNWPSGAALVRPTQPNVARKVVSIPVKSDMRGLDTRRSTSAVKIQKVFRGFLVRKSMKEIILIGQQVDEVKRMILGSLDLIRRDANERQRMNEVLMGLLFKLDSVRGVGPGVRYCRKAVIKKAIALQEKIDGADQENPETEGPGEFGTEHCTIDSMNGNQDLDVEDVIDDFELVNGQNLSEKASHNFGSDVVDCAIEIKESGKCGIESDVYDSMNTNQDVDIDDMINDPKVVDKQKLSDKTLGNFASDEADPVLEIEGKAYGIDMECCNDATEKIDNSKPEIEGDNSVKFEADKEEDDYCIVKQVVVDEGEKYDTKPTPKQVQEDSYDSDGMLKMQDDEAKPVKEEALKDREIKERMMEENAKMTRMMRELFEQNQAQSQMLSSMSLRLDQLEKALVSEKLCKKTKEDVGQNQALVQMQCSMRQQLYQLEKALVTLSRKKKKDKTKRTARGVTDGFDFYLDQKTCGKR